MHTYLEQFVVIFIDDILILKYFKSHEDHKKHLQTVLQTLKDKQLCAKLKKCEFWLAQISFLGHVISRARIFVFFFGFYFFLRMARISVDPKKIEAIVNWERPKTVMEICNFLGLASYLAGGKIVT